jgi:hypothetical protein
MSRPRWKLATATFAILIAINAALLGIEILHPGNVVVLNLSRLIQLPGVPLLFFVPLPWVENDYGTYAHLALASSLTWAMLAVYINPLQRTRTDAKKPPSIPHYPPSA